MLNEQGVAYAGKYYSANIKDFQQELAKGLTSDDLVDDNAAHRHKMAAVPDLRFAGLETRPVVEVLVVGVTSELASTATWVPRLARRKVSLAF